MSGTWTPSGTPTSDNDTFVGTASNDSANGGDGNDSLVGLGGNDTLLGGIGNDTLDGGNGNDSLVDFSGNNVLVGGSGNDTLYSGSGDDSLVGGAGNDVLIYDTSLPVTANLATGLVSSSSLGNDTVSGIEYLITGDVNDTITGSVANETLVGGLGNDSILGGDGDDSLVGGGGNDTLNGGAGNDTLAGGPGADSLVGGTGTNWVDYLASSAGVTVALNTNANTGGDAQGDSMAGGNFLGLIGSAYADTLIGDGSANSILGADGNDSISAGSGNDYVDGGAGNDSIDAGNGDDTVLGGLGSDTIIGGAGNDALVGDNVSDTTTGSGDSILGGDGNDTLFGGAGNDTLVGGTGNDTLVGGVGDDSLYDTGTGSGNNLMLGGDGNDTIVGGSGANTIVGGKGNDYIMGGNGAGSYYWSTGDGTDTINDGGGQDTVFVDGWVTSGGTTTNWSPLKTGDTFGNWTVTKSGGGNAGYITNTTGERIYFDNSINEIAAGTTPPQGPPLPPQGPPAPCFATGTMIATARGEVAVEDLRVGDLVLTAQGGAPLQPVVWLGHSKVDLARHPNRRAIAPVVIRAGALGKGMPHRDLRVSPDHGIFVDGYLVPAGRLVNGTTIVQEMWRPAVTYWHVELPAHGLVVSEGAVSESYLDDGNRKHFDNYAITTLFKDFASERANGRYKAQACRPVLEEGEALDRIRARLSSIADSARTRSLTA